MAIGVVVNAATRDKGPGVDEPARLMVLPCSWLRRA